MIIRIGGGGAGTTNETPPVRMRCPACGDRALLEGLHVDFWAARQDIAGQDVAWGARRCPNPQCGALILIVRERPGPLLASYPTETLDFNPDKLPDKVRKALEEAVTCHAQGCFVASAMMVRKTLEELCVERGAHGDNLYDRIETLGSKIVLPQGMLQALHDLRMLGNDAAHIEARAFEDVGREEVEAAVEVTKEILKATYQYEDLMGRLAALKRDEAPPG